ncbi:ATP-dependent zinc metalloprotease FtsH, partial [Armadillidium nasatum]
IARKACFLSLEGPCIFFIDEIDSLGFARSEEHNSDDIHLTNQALSIIDDCRSYPNLLVMAATNRPYALDKSFLSTGRLETQILLSAPTLNQRKEILNIYCKGLVPDSHSILWDIALATPGYVGADLKNPSVVYEEMMQLLGQLSPSLYKSLEFFTERPKYESVGGLNEIKRKLDILLLGYSKLDTKNKKSWLKKPRGWYKVTIFFFNWH